MDEKIEIDTTNHKNGFATIFGMKNFQWHVSREFFRLHSVCMNSALMNALVVDYEFNQIHRSRTKRNDYYLMQSH